MRVLEKVREKYRVSEDELSDEERVVLDRLVKDGLVWKYGIYYQLTTKGYDYLERVPVRKEAKKTNKEGLPPTEYIPKPDLDELYRAIPSVKKLVEEGKFTEDDAEKTYEVWASMRAILMQASYLWYDHVEPILKRAGVPEEEREKAFYEVARHYYRLYGRKEIFSSTKIEPDLETFNKVTLFKRLAGEGKLSENDVKTISKVLMGMKGSCVQASLLWYNSMDRLLQEKGMPEEEREKLFYEMSKPFCRLFRKEEIYPKEYLERVSEKVGGNVREAYDWLKKRGSVLLSDFVSIFGADVLEALKRKDLVTFNFIDGAEYVLPK